MRTSLRGMLAMLTALAGFVAATARADTPVGLFDRRDGRLLFRGESWSVRGEAGRGWVSLLTGEAEFLACVGEGGAFAFKRGDTWVTKFPDLGNISHDDSVGRHGSVADGLNLIRISPERNRPEFELYCGANEKAPQQLYMFLSDDVALIRLDAAAANSRTIAQRMLTAKSRQSQQARDAVIIHKSGSAIVVQSTVPQKNAKGEAAPPVSFEIGPMLDPQGKRRLAVAFPCAGFAANSYRISLEPVARAENFMARPGFDVKSSDDPAKQTLGATNGVGNPVYAPATKLDFAIGLDWHGPTPFKGVAELEVVHSLGQRHFYQKVDLAAGPAGDAPSHVRGVFSPKFTMPGVSEVWGRIIDDTGRLVWVGRYRMAWDLEHYKPAIKVEADFDAFWDKTLAELRATTLDAKTERVKAFEDHPTFEIYDVTFNTWDQQRAHAMLFIPKGIATPAPAIVTAHPGTTGFGVTKRPDGLYGSEIRQDKRFVTIVPLIRGHAPDAAGIPFNPPWWGPLGDRDTYVARAWYCNMVRAVDYLATRPELVDMKRVIVRGGSQGGALALVTAGLDPRVAVCLADCPANCQPSEIMENYPSFGPSAGQVPQGKTLAEVEKALSYYNPANFCPRIKCPAYVGSNIGDLTVHSMGPLAAYHNLTGVSQDSKAFYPGFTHFHGSGPGLWDKTNDWLDKFGGPAPAKK